MPILLLATTVRILPAPAASSDTQTVCDILATLERYRGRLVLIEGWLGINWRHGLRYISEEKDDGGGCRGLRGERQGWPARILLVWPEDGPADGPVAFRAQPGEIWKRLYYHVKGSDVGITVRAVIEGELRSRPGIKIVRTDGGWAEGNGYGRNGDFPAELVIKRIVKIEPPIEVY